MSFTNPLALLLLLSGALFIWTARVGSGRVHRRQQIALALRLAILTLLTLALAGAQAVRATREQAVVFLVDVSDSIAPEQAEQAEAYVRAALAQMGTEDRAAVVLFGADALVDRPMSGLRDLAPLASRPRTLQTDLAAAIRLGLALFPAGSGRRLVLLSDGAATAGNSTEAARLAAAAGVPIDYAPLLRTTPPAEAWLTRVDAPARVAEGERFSIVAAVESTAVQTAVLRVLAAGRVVAELPVQLNAGPNSFTLPVQAGDPQFSRYTVELFPSADTYPQNNRLAAFTDIMGAPRVLVVSSGGMLDNRDQPIPQTAAQLILALAEAGLDVDETTPTAFPADLSELSSYAAVVLVDVNAKYLTPRKMDALLRYTRDLGGGLVVVGGPDSYGMGGYFRTPLEEALPVEMQIQDSERFPAVNIVIVIDRSGSMGMVEDGVSKIQLAAEGAARTVELLKDVDQFAVITVDELPDAVIGPFPAAERDAITADLRRLGAGGGGIFMRNGLQAAADLLPQMTNPIKHIIVLADGSDAEQKEGVPDLIAALTAEQVTVSMVAIGDGPDVPWLREMAELGNGRFHLTDRAASLPEIFTQETTIIQRSYIVEERFFPTLTTRSPILSGISVVPPLYGYVATAPKQTAQVILSTPKQDPLLAQWQIGLGRAVAWTSDATGRWGVEWVGWQQFAAFWAQAVRWTITPERAGSVETAVTLQDGQAAVTVDVRDTAGRLVDNLTPLANVVGPDGRTLVVPLIQSAPGRYAGTFTPTAEGAYLVRIGADDATAVGQTTGWVLGYSPEYRQLAGDRAQLEQLARLTGGRDVAADPTLPFTLPTPSGRAARPIWHVLTFVAVLLLPLDIAVRRLVITRGDLERALVRLRLIAPRPTAATPAAPSEQAERLLQAKQRAGLPRAAGLPGAAGRPDAAGETAAPQPPAEHPAPIGPPSSPPPTPPDDAAPLSARLLEKKRRREGDRP